MKQNTKDWIHNMSAVALILSAIAMGFVSFLTTEEIGPGPLTYIGEVLSSALAIFGIGVYATNKIGEIKTRVDEELLRIKKEEVNATHQ